MAKTTPTPGTPDWSAIEVDFRAGVKALRTMAGEHGITEGAIRKRAKRDGWERDLSGKIAARAEELVRKDAVRAEVRNSQASAEKAVVEANAELQKDIILGHRKDIRSGRKLAMRLMTELDMQTDSVDLLEQLGEMLRKEDDKGQDKLNDLYHKIIAHPGRIDSLKKLAETMKHLIGLERQAFGLNETQERERDGLSDLLSLIQSRNTRLPIQEGQ